MPTASTFATLLRQHRLAIGLTQEGLAERAGLSVHGVQKLERGATHPYRDTAQRLASALALAPDDRDRFLDAVHPLRRRRAEPRQVGNTPLGATLPSPLTSLIGRDHDVRMLSELLASARLVTLTGAGGVGKTRLALAVAARLADRYADGVAFVDLAPLRDERLVAATIAWSLGLTESGGRSARELLQEHLRNRQVLLVLDNFEHLLGAAPLVAALIQRCPRVAVLATSRTVLHVQGERRIPVDPLAIPRAETDPAEQQLSAWPAVRLFIERAQTGLPGFALSAYNGAAVAAICRHLDGLPLAIELAAARVPLLAPEALLRRLEHRLPLLTGGAADLPDRHRTLRGTLAWSYDLLAPLDQVLFRRLAVFAGGWFLEAAETVCADAQLPPGEVLDRLQKLVDASLVRRSADPDGEPRFGMLETIREYAAECLEAAGERSAVQQRHVEWCLGLAEASRAEQLAFAHIARLAQEQGNLRAALRACIVSRDAATGLRLGVAMWPLWFLRALYAEGRAWLDELLALESPTPTALRARALTWAGHLAYCQGDFAAARLPLDEAVATARLLADDLELVAALVRRSAVTRRLGDAEGARGQLAEALALSRGLDDRFWTALALNQLCALSAAQRDYQTAIRHITEALELWRAQNHRWGTARALLLLGGVATSQGDFRTASAPLTEALQLARQIDDRQGVVAALLGLATCSLEAGEAADVGALLAEALSLTRDAGDRLAAARCLESIAALVAANQPEPALRLAAAAMELRHVLGTEQLPSESARQARWQAVARGELGDAAARVACAAGQRQSPDHAISEALALAAAGAPTAAHLRT